MLAAEDATIGVESARILASRRSVYDVQKSTKFKSNLHFHCQLKSSKSSFT